MAQTIRSLADAVNREAHAFQMRDFQQVRSKLHGLMRPKSYDIFTEQTIFDTYAYHSGGRKELQFNIGLADHEELVRFGVAFSLDPSQTLPDPLVLRPKILRLNKFFVQNGPELIDLRFWYDATSGRSPIFPAGPVDEVNIAVNTFLFWGKLAHREDVDAREILFLFDRLLPLYEYVEGNGRLPKVSANINKGFQFKAGLVSGTESAIQMTSGGRRTVDLHHKKLQKIAQELLGREFGQENVGPENDTGRGSRIDLVVRRGTKHDYYEIKTSLDIRTCIREALSQLMEYSLWPGGTPCERMIIISENPMTKDAQCYLQILRSKYQLPIFYRHLVASTSSLGKLE